MYIIESDPSPFALPWLTHIRRPASWQKWRCRLDLCTSLSRCLAAFRLLTRRSSIPILPHRCRWSNPFLHPHHQRVQRQVPQLWTLHLGTTWRKRRQDLAKAILHQLEWFPRQWHRWNMPTSSVGSVGRSIDHFHFWKCLCFPGNDCTFLFKWLPFIFLMAALRLSVACGHILWCCAWGCWFRNS